MQNKYKYFHCDKNLLFTINNYKILCVCLYKKPHSNHNIIPINKSKFLINEQPEICEIFIADKSTVANLLFYFVSINHF